METIQDIKQPSNTNILPKFAFKDVQGVWHRMDEEKAFVAKITALNRRRELKWADELCKRNIRVIKHNERYFLYEKRM